jgi:peptide/nickel transport system permease protein
MSLPLDPAAESSTVELGGRGLVRGWRVLRRSPRMIVGLSIVLFFVLVALYGTFFVHDGNALSNNILKAPSAHDLLGTTQLGQNVLSQLIASAGPTLLVGFAAGLLATIVAVAIGIGGGFLGGRADDLLNLFTNVVLVIPAVPLIIVVSGFLKAGGIGPIILIIAFTSWAGVSRVLRGLTLSMRNRDFIAASKLSGERTWRIVIVELLPNTVAFVISGFIFTVIFAILTQAGLAFLGLGDVNALTWGNMIYWAQVDGALEVHAWWWFVPPGLCIAVLGMGLALINFGLDEVLNPRLRSQRAIRQRPSVFDEPAPVETL